jgi:hypothetical protein
MVLSATIPVVRILRVRLASRLSRFSDRRILIEQLRSEIARALSITSWNAVRASRVLAASATIIA